MITLDAALERDPRTVMLGRGLASEEEALRTVMREAAVAFDTDARKRREEAIRAAHGAWAGRGPDLPRTEDGRVEG